MEHNKPRRATLLRDIRKNPFSYLLVLPAVAYTFLFGYCTLPYVIIAFQKFNYKTGIFHSEFVGLKNTPEVQLVGNLVSHGLWGEVYFGEGEYLHNLDVVQAASPRNQWRKFRQLGKRGMFYPTHSIGPVIKWFGQNRIVSVASFGTGSHTSPLWRQDDTTITVCTTEKGRLIKLRLDGSQAL